MGIFVEEIQAEGVCLFAILNDARHVLKSCLCLLIDLMSTST